MLYLIKFIFLLLISHNLFANENNSNQILFKINNKVFTNIDFEKRKEYVALINNFTQSEFNQEDNKEIFSDYISSLIFYEYYIQNKINYKDLKKEIVTIFNKNSQNILELSEEKINNIKFNTKIDLIRNKTIEEILNSKKSELLKEVNKLDLLYLIFCICIIFKVHIYYLKDIVLMTYSK